MFGFVRFLRTASLSKLADNALKANIDANQVLNRLKLKI